MSRNGEISLEERVERLEEQGRKLRAALLRLERGSERASGEAIVEPGKASRPEEFAAAARKRSEPSFSEPAVREERGDESSGRTLAELVALRSGEWWLGKIGIGLLLLGVAFLFKFSVDQGWITPIIRVGFGLAIGSGLLALGLRVYENRRSFSQVLLGGGVGTLYITGYAANEWYSLVSWPAAFAFMSAVTVLAFALAIRQDTTVLSITGTVGGLLTPFLLYTEDGSVGGLVLYTCTILAGVVAIFLYKGWRSLLIVSFIGVWMVFFIGAIEASGLDKWALQVGVAFGWISFWIAPVLREVLHHRSPERWTFPIPGTFTGMLGDEEVLRSDAHARVLTLTAPLISIAITSGVWSLESQTTGLISLGGAAVYALASLALRRVGVESLSYIHALTSLTLGTLALVMILDGNALFVALAVEAVALHFFAKRLPNALASVIAHVLFAVVGVWFSARVLFDGFVDGGYPFDFTEASTQFIAISLAFIASFALPATASLVYRIAAHVGLLAWIWSVFAFLPNGEGWTTVVWGVCGAALIVAGLRRDDSLARRVGMATLF
ncbi:MAG: DUF2339 domain-containing protein, partial [Rubrobacteraceae bacterium]